MPAAAVAPVPIAYNHKEGVIGNLSSAKYDRLEMARCYNT